MMATLSVSPTDPYGLLSPQIFQSPHESYHLLRHADPVHWHEATASWILTSYGDIYHLINRPDLLSSAERRGAARRRLEGQRLKAMTVVDDYLRDWVLDLDPPRHTVIRQRLNRWFTAKALRPIQPRMRTLASELAAEFVARGGGDVVSGYAHPFPVRMIAEIVGVPDDDYPRLLDWFARLSLFFERGAGSLPIVADAVAVIGEVDAWLERLIESRRSQPRDDIISGLATGKVPELSERGLRSTLLLLLFGGHESSRATISNGILALLQSPRELARLRQYPDLIGPGIEEFLRFDGPFMRQDRLAIMDFEVRHRRIRAGDRVVLVLGAGNRDPARFHAPDIFILDRPANQHLAFGHGIHFCLGSRLARIEIAIAIQALIAAAPGLQIGPGGYRWREHFNNRGLAHLDLVAN